MERPCVKGWLGKKRGWFGFTWDGEEHLFSRLSYAIVAYDSHILQRKGLDTQPSGLSDPISWSEIVEELKREDPDFAKIDREIKAQHRYRLTILRMNEIMPVDSNMRLIGEVLVDMSPLLPLTISDALGQARYTWKMAEKHYLGGHEYLTKYHLFLFSLHVECLGAGSSHLLSA